MEVASADTVQAAYASRPTDSPEQNWAESERDDSDGDDEHRCLASGPLDLSFIGVRIRQSPVRMLSLPSASRVSLHLRC